MAILLGALASLLIGGSDFLGRYGTRRSNAITAVSGALVGGIAVTGVAMFVIPSSPTMLDTLLGVGSGAVLGVALATLYEAMSTTSAAVAAPLVALGAACFPLGWDVALGGRPSLLVGAGVAVALVGLVVVMYSPGLTGDIGRGVRIALLSAVLFGVSLTLVGETSTDSGVWAPFAQRVTASAVMLLLAVSRSVPLLPVGRRLRHLMFVSGVLGAGGVMAFTLGSQRGELGAVAVAASMFPAVSAGLAAAFDEDTLRWWQVIGIGGVVSGISMMALG